MTCAARDMIERTLAIIFDSRVAAPEIIIQWDEQEVRVYTVYMAMEEAQRERAIFFFVFRDRSGKGMGRRGEKGRWRKRKKYTVTR